MEKTAPCFKVPKRQGEKAISIANKLGLADKSLSVSRDGDWLFIPLVQKPLASELEKLRELPEIEITSGNFEVKKLPSETFAQALEGKLQPELLDAVPQAFDIIGDIVVIEIPKPLQPYQSLIGEAILQTHKNIKTVLGKAGDVSGIFRIRDYFFLAGEHRTSTVHREFGCTYQVDLGKAYFSPRLSHEHQRVASLVQPGEVVVDLFAGVGPFAVLIAKKCPSAKVYAVDLNPDAVELLKVNVRLNRVDGRVFPVCANAREIAGGKLKGSANRVIMNLPETAIDFVDAACHAVKSEGGIVHFYGFVRSPDIVENLKQRFSKLVETNGRRVESFIYTRGIRETAPFESQVVVDAKIQ